MNALTPTQTSPVSLAPSPSPANDTRLTRPRRRRDDSPLARAHARFDAKLRAAAARYVGRADVDDLVQDVWLVAAQRPRALAGSDRSALAWLIGIAKRTAPVYACSVTLVPLDELLAGEAGDDLEGREPEGKEEVPW